MDIKKIISHLSFTWLAGNTDHVVTGITNDSRAVQKGNVFVAIKGYESDGHKYLQDAVEKGAVCLVFEDADALDGMPEDLEIATVQVEDSRIALAEMASVFYGKPSRSMKMVGVTGTNGKTSTALLTYHILENCGHPAGVIGTISNRIRNREIPTNHTTPESHILQKTLAEMVEEGVETAVMEVSSHALALHRVDGIVFQVAAFTNLSLDHLDFHKTMEDYLAAKSKLFQISEIGIINADDKASEQMISHHFCEKILRYSILDSSADYYAENIQHSLTGTQYTLCVAGEKYDVFLLTPGNFSVYNSLAAIAITHSLGIPLSQIVEGLRQYSRVRGRFQSIPLPGGFTAIVDYAHTPDGLENVLKSIAEFKKARVITVFGCGGDRDRRKRPIMAKIAEKYSDYVWITSDNPRTEDPDAIIREVALGMERRNYSTETDRKQAIYKALEMAQPEDIILIAGKGHEDYQILGKEKIRFDDVEVVEEWGKKQCYSWR